ncbi:ribonuclease H protein [Tanacetum coccineum]
MAELLAIRSACRLAITYGWHNASVESDSKLSISLVSSKVEPPWALAAIVVDIKAWASQLAISFSWAKRGCNLAALLDNVKPCRRYLLLARRVAKIAFRSLDNFVWDDNFPDEITSAARSDAIGIYFCGAFAFLLTGGVKHVDLLSGWRKRITIDPFGALDSVVSFLGIGDLGALGVLCVPWVDSVSCD